jgi:hypothetical protein
MDSSDLEYRPMAAVVNGLRKTRGISYVAEQLLVYQIYLRSAEIVIISADHNTILEQTIISCQ